MMEKIKEAASSGESVCVIVPDQFTFEYERILYDHLGCRLFNRGNTEVWSFSRLTRDIFAGTAAPKGAAADKTAKIAVMSRAVAEAAEKNQLAFFAKQAKKPSFVSTVMTMLGELIHSRVTPEKLSSIIGASSGTSTDKLTDILTLYADYSDRLLKAGMRDNMFDIGLAAEISAKSGYFDGKYIFMDEFKSFTGDQYEMIRAMLKGCRELTVCMTADNSTFGGSPFASVFETCGYLAAAAEDCGVECRKTFFSENKKHGAALAHLTDCLSSGRKIGGDMNADNVCIIKAPEIYSECSFICAEICGLVSSGKYRFGDIAVLSRSMSEDISVLAAHFDRYNIPYYCDRKPSVAHKPMILMVTSALELAASASFSTEVLFRYLKTGLTEITEDEIHTLENFCYEWDIDGNMWQKDFPKGRDEPDEGDTSVCEEIKRRALAPIYSLKNGCKNKNGREICSALREFIKASGAESRLPSAAENNITQAETAELLRENERLCEELDSLIASLERAFAADDNAISLADFRDIFMLSAGEIALSAPPQSLDCVTAQQSDLARLSNPKVVFVMHANDGIFPFIPKESVTFTEAERELFRKAGSDLSGSMKKRLTDEKFNAFKAVCSPSERLYVSYSETDISGKKLYPSEYIEKIRNALPKCRSVSTEELGLLFYCRTEQAAYSAAAEKFGTGGDSFVTVRAMLEKNPLYRDKFSYLDSIDRGISSAHRISDSRITEKLYGKRGLNISASRFEDYSICPFRYYCTSGLKIRPLQKNGLTAINWGNAVHACMKDILEKFPKDKFVGLSGSELKREVIRASKKFVNEEMNGGFGKPASFPVYLRIMRENILRSLTRLQLEMSGSEFVPDAFEVSIGRDSHGNVSSAASMDIVCEDGRRVNFFGTADRVDLYEKDGRKYIRVIDYKTGAKSFSLDQIENGINLQMFLYLFSLTDDENGLYKDAEPAGALYVPVHFPLLKDKRDALSEDIEANMDSSLKMIGEILKDGQIADAMEKISEGEEGRFIPAARNSNGDFTKDSSVLSEKGFEYIKETSVRLLKEMCANVYEGKLPASPLKSEGMTSNCDRCSFREICSSFPDIEIRPMLKSNFKEKE